MAEDERGRILKRANDGRAAAKAKGTRFGRKPKRRKLPIDRQDDGRAPRYGREAGWVGAARV